MSLTWVPPPFLHTSLGEGGGWKANPAHVWPNKIRGGLLSLSEERLVRRRGQFPAAGDCQDSVGLLLTYITSLCKRLLLSLSSLPIYIAFKGKTLRDDLILSDHRLDR